jgi:hypothetical protein
MKKPTIIQISTTTTITSFLISAFLSGKIISFPQGTPKGGIIAGIGVLVIMVTVVALNILVFQFLKNKNKQNIK